MKVGVQALTRGRITKETIKNIIYPVNYWRTIEYKIVFDELHPTKHDRILDIGSPKLLSLFIAEKYSSELFSIDINGKFIEEYQTYRRLRGIDDAKYHPLVMDARILQFPDAYFTKIFSISVLEHIPGHGDAECLKEIGRVLSPGGVCAITVPFSPQSKEEFRDPNDFYWSNSYTGEKIPEKIFFQRRYSEQDLFERIITPSRLKVKKLQYIGEKILTNKSQEFDEYMNLSTAPLQPLMSHLFHTKPSNSWKDLQKPLAAFIVLEKT
jgi:ubiquinone/menaquinone biosynthesis C-methylase UbiE